MLYARDGRPPARRPDQTLQKFQSGSPCHCDKKIKNVVLEPNSGK